VSSKTWVLGRGQDKVALRVCNGDAGHYQAESISGYGPFGKNLTEHDIQIRETLLELLCF
jgi:hypothetical protein